MLPKHYDKCLHVFIRIEIIILLKIFVRFMVGSLFESSMNISINWSSLYWINIFYWLTSQFLSCYEKMYFLNFCTFKINLKFYILENIAMHVAVFIKTNILVFIKKEMKCIENIAYKNNNILLHIFLLLYLIYF